jgi:hypothetical protein
MPAAKSRSSSSKTKVKKTKKPQVQWGWHRLLTKKYIFGGVVIVAFAIVGLAMLFGGHAATPLAFDMPSQGTLKNSSKKVFAHYFTPYPISLDNGAGNSDYYARNYLAASGEGGKHASYGGLLRERPLPRATDPSSQWQLNDMKTEVTRATQAGLDGFTVDMLGLSGAHWDRLNLLLQASKQVDPNFKIMLMPDSNAGSINGSPQNLAKSIAQLNSSYGSSLYKLNDGRLVVSPFYAEKLGVNWWTQFISTMQNTYNIKVAFVPCFLNYGSNAAAFNSISYGFSNWGNRNPAMNQNLAANIADAHNRGKVWMQPVSVQDERPNQGIYDEANNTENLRLTWSAAINNGADWVQVPTWNDYSEGAEITPSTNIGWSPLDITSYYLTRFKTGSWPKITQDVAYVSHRVQFASAKPTTAQSKLMNLRGGSSPARDAVEVLSYLSGAATVKVTVGNNVYTYAAPAGEFVKTYPLAVGTVKVEITRGNTTTKVTSPFPVVSNPVVQDMQYHFVSTSRNGTTVTTGGGTTTPTPPTPPTPSTNSVTGAIKGIGTKCLDNWRSNKTNGNKIELYKCNTTDAQKWTINKDGTIVNANGYCLDVAGASKKSETLVQLYACNGTVAQKWSIDYTKGAIVNPNSGLCLDDQYGKTDDGNQIWVYTCNGTAAQKWTAPKL